jgi:hypothetical protein
MAIRTDDLTARNLGLNARKGVALVNQHGDPGGLLANVVELQDERIRKPAVSAPLIGEKAKHVAPCLGPSAFARGAGLMKVELSALEDVLGSTALAPSLGLVEISQREVSLAPSTTPPPYRADRGRGQRGPVWLRRLDPAGPSAHRAERNAQLECNRAQRFALRAKSSGFLLLVGFPRRHTNICSLTDRTA